MSNINYETFLSWAINHFGAENIRIRKGEILTHSPFCEDQRFNLWLRPDGGKKNRENGVFRCWKTDRRGSLVKLVSDLDNIPYEEAEELLGGNSTLRQLEQQIHEMFGAKTWEIPEITEPVPEPLQGIDLPPHTYLIDDLSKNHPFRQAAEEHLASRSIPTEGLYVCTRGDYKNRIIIPYYDQDGDLVYWNARTLSSRDDVPKYIKPNDENLDQTLVLYMQRHPKKGERIYLTEGEFDAMSLTLSGLCGVGCGGKFLSDVQINMIRPFIPIIATDNDEKKRDAGLEALLTIGGRLLEKGFGEVYYIRPPVGFKDWNALLHVKGADRLREYVVKHTKPFTNWTKNELICNHL
jgi:Toprim-like